MLFHIIVLLFSIIYKSSANDNVTNPKARDIIDNYDEKLPLVTVTYTYEENMEVFHLNTVKRTRVLEHINVFLKKYHLDNSNIHVVVTETDGFLRINGISNYNVIPLYNGAYYSHSCSHTNESDPFETIHTRRYRRCSNLKLTCLPFLDDKNRSDNSDSVKLLNKNNFDSDLYENLSDIKDRRLLKHIKSYIQKHSMEKIVNVTQKDGIIKINNELQYKIIPLTEIKSRILQCTYFDKISNSLNYLQVENFYKNNYYDCVNMLLACEHGHEYT